MQNQAKFNTQDSFFAAANGFAGFRSYFPEVFNSKDYAGIFILKGGPGTGKSSLLRKLCDFGEKNGFRVKKVLCSSDVYSLDGVILEKNGIRFAAIDGTAPHTRDTELPGAVDEIINLGDNWDSERLASEKRLIVSLTKKKAQHYKKAYELLSYAGKVSAIIDKTEEENIDIENIKIGAKSLAEELSPYEASGEESFMLNESFARQGLLRIDAAEENSSRVIRISESGFAARIYMSKLLSELRKKAVGLTVFPGVFEGENVRAILLNTTKTAIVVSDTPTPDIDLQRYVSKPQSTVLLKSLENAKDTLLEESRRYFSFASDLHFELEKIYISAMNFKENDIFLEKITEKIKKSVN